jgi:tetratricopeptide (TPR) repeat protein
MGGCLNNKGTIHARLGEDVNASHCLERAYEAFTAAGDEHGVAVTTHNIGAMKLTLGEPAEAITWLRTALAMNIRRRNEWAIANGHRSLGDASKLLNHRTEAWSHYRQSLYASQKCKDFAGQAASLARLAKLSLDENLLEEAVTYSEAALDMFDRVRVDRGDAAAALCVLATAHLRIGAFAAAVSMAREAVRTYQETVNTDGQIDGLILLGRIQAASGEPVEAVGTFAMAAELIASPADPRLDTVRDLLDAEQPVPAPRTEGSVAHRVDEVPEDISY